jgi:DNA-directed RNA polymerase specialized sigma24 family protein
MEGVAGAERSEIEALYRRDYRRFVRVATAVVRDAERAVDVVQEAFAAALCARGEFRGEGSLEAWLWRIVVNGARRDVRAPVDLPLLYAPEPATSEPRDGGTGFAAAVAELPARQRQVLFLRYFADLDYDTIARTLGVAPGTVAATLHAAHKTLRKHLEEVRS